MLQQQTGMFRQASLERLSSPEQLDQMMKVTTPKGWIALVALCGLILITIIWSIIGSIPTTVSGTGMLLKAGGIYDVQVMGSGLVSEVNVEVGDYIEKGQVIARISQPDTKEQIAQTREMQRLLEQERRARAGFTERDVDLQFASLRQQRKLLERTIEVAQERIKWLERRVTAQKEALEIGIITPDVLQNTIQSLEAGKGEIANSRTQLEEISIREHGLQMKEKGDLYSFDQQILDAKRRLESLEFQLSQNTKVTSPYTGYVKEVKVDEGSVIRAGQSIVSIEKADAPLQTVAFITGEGKKLRPGMKVQVSPITVKQEEYGFMLGRVSSVSALPASQESMMTVWVLVAKVQACLVLGFITESPMKRFARVVP